MKRMLNHLQKMDILKLVGERNEVTSTGDIVEQRQETMFVIIDRKKSIFKLSTGISSSNSMIHSSGEFISPTAVEGILSKSLLVDCVYVHGDPHQSFTVAIGNS